MADQSHRRSAKPFEPPPWEKEQFEELARERERAAQAAAEAEAAAAQAVAEAAAEHEQAEEQSSAPERPAEPAAVAAGAAPKDEKPVEASPSVDTSEESGEDGLGDPRVDAMLMMLKAEEPDTVSGIWKVGMVAGAFLAMMGLVLVVWAGVALARTLEAGPTAYLGAGIMGLMGAGLVALGVWLIVRSLRKQGVL